MKQECGIVDNPWNWGRKDRGSSYYPLYLSLKTLPGEKKGGMNDFEMVRWNTAKPRCPRRPRWPIATLAVGFSLALATQEPVPAQRTLKQVTVFTTVSKGKMPFVGLHFIKSLHACLLDKLFSKMAKGWSWKQERVLKGRSCSLRSGSCPWSTSPVWPQDTVPGATPSVAFECGRQKPILALEENPPQKGSDAHETAFQALAGFSRDCATLFRDGPGFFGHLS